MVVGIAIAALILVGSVVLFWAVVRGRLGGRTIRTRLMVGFVFMAALPAISISAGTAAVGYSTIRKEATNRLQTVAARKESEIKVWTQSAQSDLAMTLSVEHGLQEVGVALDLAQENKYYVFFSRALRDRLQTYVAQSNRFQELSLLDSTLRVVISSDSKREGDSRAQSMCMQRALEGPAIEINTSSSSSLGLALDVGMPVLDPSGRRLGVMAGQATIEGLPEILQDRTGLEESGRAYLVSAEGILIADSESAAPQDDGVDRARSVVRNQAVEAALRDQAVGSEMYVGSRHSPVVGVYRWLPDLQAALVVEQDQSEAFQSVYSTLAVNGGVALACLALAVAASLWITRTISRPLVTLAATATRISDGDLKQSAAVSGEDEVGALARAFNKMTAQLRGLIAGLEERVAERTHALERRALQLETSARVSREITSILGIDELLARVAERIRVTFGYYHVNVFLVEAGSADMELRASSGAPRPGLEHIAIGDDSLNGQAALENRTWLANDVTKEPRFRADAALPDTRAEVVVPLRVGDRVVGTLDVQSSEANAFATEDVLVLESLADQIAIAIENARLYVKSRELATLEERNRLARELHDVVTQSLYSITLMAETWRRLADEAGHTDEESRLRKLGEAVSQAHREARLLVHELRPSPLEQEGLLGALHQRLDAVERRSGVEARLLTDEILELPAEVEEELYGIAVEALNNAIKHSGATSVAVTIHLVGQRVTLEVQDNGCGLDPAAASGRGGLGLTTMCERAARLGGRLDIESGLGQGTLVRVVVDGVDAKEGD